jgi:hypothetical protein
MKDIIMRKISVCNRQMRMCMEGVRNQLRITDPVALNAINNVGPRPRHAVRTVYDFPDHFSEKIRFRAPEHVLAPIAALGLLASAEVHTYRLSAQEVVLISLARLAYPLRWGDLRALFPNRCRFSMQRAFYWFLDFMIQNWGYLILNNMDWWVLRGSLAQSAEAIRVKLATLPTLNYRQDWPSAFNPAGGFCASCFIDNTLIATCRPGGGGGDGVQAPRVPKDVQQAWWTGWKKLHGIKWQTVMLANGMDLHVYGPGSVRHNDNWMLTQSDIVAKFVTAQVGKAMQYKIFGDSAYSDGPHMVTGGGRGLASVRETIEWEYKDLKTYWSAQDQITTCR